MNLYEASFAVGRLLSPQRDPSPQIAVRTHPFDTAPATDASEATQRLALSLRTVKPEQGSLSQPLTLELYHRRDEARSSQPMQRPSR